MDPQQNSPVNMFFALRPPEGVGRRLAALGERLQRAHRLRGAQIARERLHNTLAAVENRPGAWPETVARARQAGGRLRHPTFMARFDWTESFDVRRHHYPFVLRGELKPLADFRQALCGEMARAGLAAPRTYTPHITLLWADRPVQACPIAPIEWRVTEFVLVLSLVGQSRHILMDHWQLG